MSKLEAGNNISSSRSLNIQLNEQMTLKHFIERTAFTLKLIGKTNDKKQYLRLLQSDFYDVDLSESMELLNRHGKIHNFKRNNFWIVTDFDMAEKILIDSENFSSNKIDAYLFFDKNEVLLCADTIRHELMHGIIRNSFMIYKEEGYVNHLYEILDDIVCRLPKDDTFNLKTTVIYPLAAKSICHLAGFDPKDTDTIVSRFSESDYLQFYQWFMSFICTIDFLAYPVISENRLIPLLQQGLRDRHLSEQEVFEFLGFVFVAGTETVSSAMPRIFEKIMKDEKLKDHLIEHVPSRPKFIEEVLRLHVNLRVPRHSNADTEIDGVMIPKGQLVVIDIAATNRDPSKFDEPTDISFTKNRHRNLSFGAGMHKCIGMGIARTQLRVFLDYFLDKTQHLTIENIKWTRNRGFGVDYSDFINVRSTPKDQDNDNGPRCPFGFSKSA